MAFHIGMDKKMTIFILRLQSNQVDYHFMHS